MNVARARVLARYSRRNVGILLARFKRMKVAPTDHSPEAWNNCISLLQANQKGLRELYQEFPEIKPIRVKQLNLFKG